MLFEQTKLSKQTLWWGDLFIIFTIGEMYAQGTKELGNHLGPWHLNEEAQH